MTTAKQTGLLQAGIIGRTLRLMLGALFAWMTYTVMRAEDAPFNLRVLAVFGALTLFYTLLHAAVARFGSGSHRWLGAVGAVVPIVLVFALGGPAARVAASAFVGLSFLLQTWRGDASCEVLAIPAAVFHRPTHLAGILFSPIDLVEKHLTGPGGLPGPG